MRCEIEVVSIVRSEQETRESGVPPARCARRRRVAADLHAASGGAMRTAHERVRVRFNTPHTSQALPALRRPAQQHRIVP